MKKKNIYLLMLLCLVLISGILLLDYFKFSKIFTPVDQKVSHGEQEQISGENLQEEVPVILEEKTGSAKICIFGDNLIHENVLKEANRNIGGSGTREDFAIGFDFKPLYQNIMPIIEDADFSVCNQASLVGANDSPAALSGYPLFNSPSCLGKDLVELGFDGVNVANNHLLDMGSNGLIRSIAFWESQNIVLMGGDRTEEAFQDIQNKIVGIGDVRIAFLSYTATTNAVSPDSNTLIPYFTLNNTAIKKAMIQKHIKFAKDHSDAVVVLVNWGNGSSFDVTEFQKEAAQVFCDAGADVIVGTGPKVIQKMEWLSSQVHEHKTLCAYSLGNLMCTMEYMDNLLGGVLCFEVEKEGSETCITNILFQPTVIHYDKNFSNIRLYPLQDYTEELFLTHGSNLNLGFGPYSWYRDTLKKYIPGEYLPAILRS